VSICTELLCGPPDPLWQPEVRFRTPTRLVPILVAFFLDSVGTGLASPLLPFYIMSLGANAFQLGTPTWTAVESIMSVPRGSGGRWAVGVVVWIHVLLCDTLRR
jgi:hypothetical protein